MEKGTKTYDLEDVKLCFSDASGLAGRITNSAFKGAAELGCSREDIIDVIQSLVPSCFYKSMTSYSDHKVWQDVYHTKHREFNIYLKFTVKPDGDYLLLSFKEK